MAKRRTQESSPVSVQEQNKEIVRRFYAEVMGAGNMNSFRELVDPGFVDHGETLFGSPNRDELEMGIGFRIEDGKIKERWFNSDSMNVVIQMGVVQI
jgi:predicted SnoaL-like aldol condensation-catalyzing enzyme